MVFISLVPTAFAFVLNKDETALFVSIGFPIILTMLWCATTASNSKEGL